MLAFSRRLRLVMVPFFLNSLCSIAFAENHMVVMGGGGDSGSKTIFDSTYKTLMTSSAFSQWRKISVFDGGHSDTEKMIAKYAKGSNKSATTAGMNSTIADLQMAIRSGSIKKGDQLFLNIVTHGLSPTGKNLTHTVVTTNGEFNVDEMKKLRDLAESKGVKLAIFDASCHSGYTLALATNKTCVVTGTGEGVGYNTTGSDFAEKIKPGASIEDVFLNMRNLSPDVLAAPQISSPAGRKAYETTKSLSHAMMDLDTLRSPNTDTKKTFGAQCSDFKKLQDELQRLTHASVNSNELSGLKKAIETYNNKRKSVQSKIDAASSLGPRKCIDYNEDWQLCGTFDALEASYQDIKGSSKKLNERDQLKHKALDHFVKSAEFTKWKTATTNLSKLPSLEVEAEKVAIEEKKLYSLLYKQYSKEAKGANPCKDFVF